MEAVTAEELAALSERKGEQLEEFRPCDISQTIAQLGHMNILAISGGRVSKRGTGITLPISNGYSLTIDLAWDDTYTVRRLFTRSGKVSIKGELTGVYCDDLADVAYYGSCFRSHPDWGNKVWQDTVNGKEE